MTERYFKTVTWVVCMIWTGFSCSSPPDQRGLEISESNAASDKEAPTGIARDSVRFPVRPSSVMLTGNPRYRITTIYKVNFARDSSTFIGSDEFHYNYSDFGDTKENQWHGNYLPGLEALYGYNLVNISHFDVETEKQKLFFDSPVLIRTVYFPTYSKDTLNYKPVVRNYFMVSVYDEDTNKDGFINADDLRRFYSFDIQGNNKYQIVPANYSVFKSEYDPGNDRVHIFARLDQNGNGKVDELEPVHIFWVDLKNPQLTGRQY